MSGSHVKNSVLKTRKEAITSNFQKWLTECRESLLLKHQEVIAFSPAIRQDYFARRGIDLIQEEQTTYFSTSSTHCTFEANYQLTCDKSILHSGKYIPSMPTAFTLDNLTQYYGFPNTSIHPHQWLNDTFGGYFIPAILVYVALVPYMNYAFFYISIVVIFICILGLAHLNDTTELITTPLEFLQALHNQGYSFVWYPKMSSNYVLVWSDGKTLHIHTPQDKDMKLCITYELSTEIVDYLKDNPYTQVVYEYKWDNKDLTLNPLYEIDEKGVSSHEIFETHDNTFCYPFTPTTYGSTLLQLPSLFEEHLDYTPEGAYIVATLGGEFIPVAQVSFTPSSKVNIEERLCRLQEQYVSGSLNENNLTLQEIAHLASFSQYVEELATSLGEHFTYLSEVRTTREVYTNYVKKLTLPSWLTNQLYLLRNDNMFFTLSPLEAVKQILNSEVGSFTLIETLQTQKGKNTQTWFIPTKKSPLEEKKVSPQDEGWVIVVDFTEINKTSCRKNIITLLKTYSQIGCDIIITACENNYADMRLNLERENIDVKACFTDLNSASAEFQRFILEKLQYQYTSFKMCVHIHANASVLTQCMRWLPRSMNYIPLHIQNDRFSYIKAPTKPMVITIVRGHNSNTTATLRDIAEFLDKRSHLYIMGQYNMEAKDPSREESNFMLMLNEVIANGEILLLDTCHTKSSLLKTLSLLAEQGYLTLVAVCSINNSEGKVTLPYLKYHNELHPGEKQLFNMKCRAALRQALDTRFKVHMLASSDNILSQQEMLVRMLEIVTPCLGTPLVKNNGFCLAIPLLQASIPRDTGKLYLPVVSESDVDTMPCLVGAPCSYSLEGIGKCGSDLILKVKTSMSSMLQSCVLAKDVTGLEEEILTAQYNYLTHKRASCIVIIR